MIDLLKTLGLPADAERWLADMWDVIQLFDDIEDGDDITNGNRVLWAVLVDMPMNPFFIANQMSLVPVVATQIHKWQAANAAEAAGKANEQSYMWRAGYYDLILIVCHICFGRNIDTQAILALYGETYAEYEKEFEDARTS